MPDNENKKQEKAKKEIASRPLSETIENAHAAGDGALERDRDTVLGPKDEKEDGGEKERKDSNEAY